MEYVERTYRDQLSAVGRSSFLAKHHSSDLWIAVDEESFSVKMRLFVKGELEGLWRAMSDYIYQDPEYHTSLVPYTPSGSAPEIMHRMSEASRKAGIGPMGAVAGAVALHVAEALSTTFGCREVIVENGGDIYARIAGLKPLDVSVWAGGSPLSGKVGFTIDSGHTPIGICTSSGTVGPSLSFGKADAVMIVCRDVLVADSYATSFANRVVTVDDIDKTIEAINCCPEILGAIVIKDDRLGVAGSMPLRLFR